MKFLSVLLFSFLTVFSFASDTDSITNIRSQFEQNFLAESSSELTSIISSREELLRALADLPITKDTSLAIEKFESLKNIESKVYYTMSFDEILFTSIILSQFDVLEKHLTNYYKTVYSYKPKKKEVEDNLFKYLKNTIDDNQHIYSVKNTFNRIRKSDFSSEIKDKCELVLFLASAYQSENSTLALHKKATVFISKYPNNEDTPWIKNSIHAPLARHFTKSHKERGIGDVNENKSNRLYTGGIGFNIYLGYGLFHSSFSEGTDRLFDGMSSIQILFELPIQIKRFVISFVNGGETSLTYMGLGFGYVIYDSQRFKVWPFIGISTSSFLPNQDEVGNPSDEEFYDLFVDDNFNTFFTGINGEYRFHTHHFLGIKKILSSYSIKAKYTLSYMDIKAKRVEANGFHQSISIGLGLNFW